MIERNYRSPLILKLFYIRINSNINIQNSQEDLIFEQNLYTTLLNSVKTRHIVLFIAKKFKKAVDFFLNIVL